MCVCVCVCVCVCTCHKPSFSSARIGADLFANTHTGKAISLEVELNDIVHNVNVKARIQEKEEVGIPATPFPFLSFIKKAQFFSLFFLS